MLYLLSTPTAAQSPSTISSGIFAQLSSTSNVHSPLPSITVIGSLPIWIAGIVSASPAASKSAQLAKLLWIEEGARGCGRAQAASVAGRTFQLHGSNSVRREAG